MPARGRRHLITIEAPTTTPDAAGQLIATWRFVHNAYAEIQPIAGSERIRAGENIGALTHRVRLHYIEGVNRTMRLRFGLPPNERILHINSLTVPDERRRQMDLLCEELV